MKIGVSFNNLRGLPAHINKEIWAAALDVLQDGRYLLGPQTERFEAEFAAFTKTKHCVAVDNGTNALEIALRALGIGPGNEVITVPNAGGYGTIAIKAVGATPVYADVHEDTLNIDPQKADPFLDRANAVIVTHLYGLPTDVRLLRNPRIIEDCSHAHGAMLNGMPVGSLGDIGVFSFYPTKIIGAAGDAGAIVTNNDRLASKARVLRQYGWDRANKYVVTTPGGMNSRMDEIQAAILRVKLRYFDEIKSARDKIARIYDSAFSQVGQAPKNYTPYVYVVRIRNGFRRTFIEHLANDGIETAIHYPVPDYATNGQRDLWMGTCPNAERACKEVVSLPFYPGMGLPQIQAVVKSVLGALDEIDKLVKNQE